MVLVSRRFTSVLNITACPLDSIMMCIEKSEFSQQWDEIKWNHEKFGSATKVKYANESSFLIKILKCESFSAIQEGARFPDEAEDGSLARSPSWRSQTETKHFIHSRWAEKKTHREQKSNFHVIFPFHVSRERCLESRFFFYWNL